MERGEVWWVALPELIGSEPGYRRPMVLVQADSFNRSRIQTVVAVVVTTNTNQRPRWRAFTSRGGGGTTRWQRARDARASSSRGRECSPSSDPTAPLPCPERKL